MLLRGWLVNELTGSPFMVALIPVLLMSPMLIFTLIGGELADRFKRTRIIAIFESVSASTYVVFAVLVLTGVVEAWHVLVITAIHGTSGAIVGPARQSLVGDLVRPKLQRAAIGFSPIIFNIAQITGPLIGGIVLDEAGVKVTAVLSAALVIPPIPVYLRLKTFGKSPLARHGSAIANIREGARYIWGHSMLRWYLVAGFVLVITVNTWGALFPPLAKDVLHRGAGGLATLQVAVGIGALTGAMVAVSMGQKYGEKRLSVVTGMIFAALVLGLAVSKSFWLSAVIVAFGAGVGTIYFVTNMIAMQLTADPAFRSRVISVRFVMFGFGPFGMIALGAIAEYFGTQVALGAIAVTGAALLLAVTVFVGASPAAKAQPQAAALTPNIVPPAGASEDEEPVAPRKVG
jgi:MFS family permease